MDRDLEVLCVSQFTLQCVLKGNKPDFHRAMAAEPAQNFYQRLLEDMRSSYKPELIKGQWAPLGSGSGFWVLGSGYWVLGFGYWVLGTGYWVLGFGYWVLGSEF